MTVHELNSKIHLPSLAQLRGITGEFTYQKVPGFGWFGYNKDRSHVFDCFEAFNSPMGPTYNCLLYTYATIDHPEIQEYAMRYSDVVANKLIADFQWRRQHHEFYRACREAARIDYIRYNARNMKFTDLLAELGESQLIHTGIGLITPKIQQFYCRKYSGKITEDDCHKVVLPTFYAPDHIASLEIASISSLFNKRPIWRFEEKGWYGELNRTIVGDLQELVTTRGCTWTPLISYWADKDKPISLSEKLTTPQCIEIWKSPRDISCDRSPLEIIKNKHELHKVKNYIKDLTLPQIKELEKMTGEKLALHWLSARSTEACVCGLKFTCQNNRYYVHRGLDRTGMEFTNFAVRLTHIDKENGDFYQYGFIDFNDHEIPFRIRARAFLSYQRLMRELTNTLLEAGVGIPIVAPNLKHYITNVILGFNQDNQIGTTTPSTRIPPPTVLPLEPESHQESKPEEACHSQTQATGDLPQ